MIPVPAVRCLGLPARRRTVVLGVLVGILLYLVALPYVWRWQRYGSVYRSQTPSIQVDRGDRFSLAVSDAGASVGASWRVQEQTDPAVAGLRRTEVVRSLPVVVYHRVAGPFYDGGGGTRYFTFDARKTGRTTIVLYDCYRGCDDPGDLRYSKAVRWDVVVRR